MSSDHESVLPVGTILDGKFRVNRELGRGGMAIVYEAENVDIKKRVAVKILAAELTGSRVITERFIREARAAAAIRSPYICEVYDVGTFDGRPFLVMELLEGESLYDRLAAKRQLETDETLLITTQVCKALSKAHHANIVHRDLKPENIFLTLNEEGQTVSKIVDFGLAKFYEAENEGGDKARLTKEGALFGTPAYMSPEQAKAQIDVDHRADLWALACIVYECLTGRTVWNVEQGVAMILAQIAGAPTPRPSRFRPDLPPAFDDWFSRALDRDISKRFQTAREFSERLARALLSPSTVAARPPLSTDNEGMDIDQMLSGAQLGRPTPPSRPVASAPGTGVPGAALPSSLPPAAKGRGPGFAIAMLLLASTLTLAGYAVWFYVLHPSGGVGLPDRIGGGSDNQLTPQESEPFALQLASGQEALANGKPDEASKLFSQAFEASKQNAARSFVAHIAVRSETPDGASCKIAGLGRPRSFTMPAQPVSAPALAVTDAGTIVAWGETDAKAPRHRKAFGTLLDGALRRVLPILTLTPEGEMVQEPRLFSAPDGPLLAYWDTSADEASAMVRQLDEQGRISGPPRKLSESEEKQSYPFVARAPDDTLWVAWTERTHPRVYDIMARHLDADLKPVGPAVRLTAYSPPARGTSVASKAAVGLSDTTMLVVYSLERNNDHQVLALRIPLADPELSTSGAAPVEDPASADTEARFVGQLLPISLGPGKHNVPDASCIGNDCFVVWDDEKGGAHAALVDMAGGEVIWRRVLGPEGLRPSLGRQGTELVVAWFEGSRLKLATMNRDHVATAGVLARANGYQPPASIVPGDDNGEWVVGWRDFEAAKHEAFVLRAQCQ